MVSMCKNTETFQFTNLINREKSKPTMTNAIHSLKNGSVALAASANPNGKHNVFAIIVQVLVAALTALSGVFAGCAYFG